MGVEKYNAKILYDPTGFYKKGAEIPWFEFAQMLRNGELDPGTRIEKVAANSRFRVSTLEPNDTPCLVDENGNRWTAIKNKFNNNGLEIKKLSRDRRR